MFGDGRGIRCFLEAFILSFDFNCGDIVEILFAVAVVRFRYTPHSGCFDSSTKAFVFRTTVVIGILNSTEFCFQLGSKFRAFFLLVAKVII